jgi:predicted metal-dependent peptidase
MSEHKPRNDAYYEAIFQDAMALLIKKHTFFGHILAHMVRISSKDIMTMGVTVNEKGQILLFYNTDMIRREIEENKATLKNVTSLIQHEVYHVINEHFLRQVRGKYHAWVITPMGPMLLFNVACVKENTLITMSDGTKKQIKDVRPDEKIIGVENGQLVKGSVFGIFSKEENELIELWTDHSKLTCSKEHRILTEDGYKRADELAVNETVFIAGTEEDKNETEMDKRRRRVLEKELWNDDKNRDCKAIESIGTFSEGKSENGKITKAEILDEKETGFCKRKLQNDDIYRNSKKIWDDIWDGEALHTEAPFDEKETSHSKGMDERRDKTAEDEVARIRNRYKTTGKRSWTESIGSCRNGTQVGYKANRIVEQKRERLHSEELPQDFSGRIGTELKSKNNGDLGLFASKSIAEREERYTSNAQLCNSKKAEENRSGILGRINRWRRNINNNEMQKLPEAKYNDFEHKQAIDGTSERHGFSDNSYHEQSRNCLFQNGNFFEDNTGGFFRSIATISCDKTSTLLVDEAVSRNRHETEIERSANGRDVEIAGSDKTIKLTQTRIRKKVCVRKTDPQRLYDLITTTHSYIANDVVTHNCDIAINQFIDDLPEWVLKLDSFKEIKLPKEDTGEIYYKLLYQESQKQAKQNKGKLNGLGKAVGILLPNPDAKDKKEKPTGINPNAGKGEKEQQEMPCPICDGTGKRQDQCTCGDTESDAGEGQESQEEQGQGEGQEQQKEQDGQEDEGQGKQQKQKKCPHCKGTGKEKSWQQMTDIEKINLWLPYDPEFFQKLMDELRKMGQSPTSKQTGMPGDHSRWNDVSKIPAEMVDETIKQMVRQVYNKVKFGGRGIGNLPAGIERMCKETIKPAYNFEPYLRRFVDGELFGRYVQTRKRPNRRYRWEYPGSKTETLGKIGVLADSSGSIYDEDIALFAKNLENMSQYVQIILFDVDAGIQNLREYSKRNFDKVIKGGGGTDFSDVFAVLKNYDANRNLLKHLPREQLVRSKFLLQGVQALIVMTDGQAMGVPDKQPKHLSVMWAITSKCNQPPVRWGEKIYLDNAPEKHKKKKRY